MLNLNNKGFAVSAVLYTLLVAFILFLAVVLSTLSSSSDLVRRANTDLINGDKFEAEQLKITGWTNPSNGKVMTTCKKNGAIEDNGEFDWNESLYIVKINSRYGTYYWPRDFKGDSISWDSSYDKYILNTGEKTSDNKLESSKNDLKLTIKDTLTRKETSVTIDPNICGS